MKLTRCRWHVDTILRVLSIAGNCVPEECCSNLINLIASTPELHSYGVQKMYMALTNDYTQQTLVQVCRHSIFRSVHVDILFFVHADLLLQISTKYCKDFHW